MPVTREEAVYAYRLILGRDPENEDVIRHAMNAPDVPALREAFLGSQEFQQRFNRNPRRGPMVGRFLNVSDVPIDLDCSPEQLQQMFDRIGEAWQDFGRTEPHWSVLVSDEFRQENLAANIDRFYDSGVSDIAFHLDFLRRANLPVRFGKALDFGCGVGRLSLALAAHADHVTGIDISPPHLKLAAERASTQGVSNVAFEAIASVSDMDRYSGYDLVISRIVLQHNPPPVMAALFEKLLNALAPGGAAILQVPTFINGQVFSAADYLAHEQPQMEMNSLPQRHIYEIIDRAGCQLLEVREDGAAGYDAALSHTFVMRKR